MFNYMTNVIQYNTLKFEVKNAMAVTKKDGKQMNQVKSYVHRHYNDVTSDGRLFHVLASSTPGHRYYLHG